MSVPPPSPDDERLVEEVAEALAACHLSGKPYKPQPSGPPGTDWSEFAVVAIAICRAAQDGGICGDLSPSINDGRILRLMCELPFGHGGAHQHDNGDGLPPTRWVAAQRGETETCAACGDPDCVGPGGRHQPAEFVKMIPAPPDTDEDGW